MRNQAGIGKKAMVGLALKVVTIKDDLGVPLV